MGKPIRGGTGSSNAPTPAMPILFSGQVQPAPRAFGASLYLPAFRKVAAKVGLAPTPHGVTGRRATLTLPGNGAAGRSSTCMVPFRRRMPHVFGHDSNLKIGQRGRTCTCGPSVPGRACCYYTTRWWRSRWDLHPHSSRRQRVAFLFSYESEMA